MNNRLFCLPLLTIVLHPSHTADSAELVRMAVTPNIRGQGLGNLLVKKLDDFCTESGVLQVTLSTANPRAGNFYKKCGFVNLAPEESKVYRMVKYFGERVIRKVTIVGGTHGNERIGIELVRQWAADGSILKRSTFETSVLLGNPLATDANIRYVTSDMNRQFARKDISSWDSTVTKGIETLAITSDQTHRVKLVDEEILHAKRLHQLLGPKGAVNEVYNCDFIIDLHSSVSNVGLMGMINGADKDCHAVRLSQYLLEERRADFPELRITNSKLDKNDSPNIDSISPYGIAFEVGPIAHGTLSSKLLEETRQLVYASLDFIESQNMKLIHAASLSEDVPFIGTATSEKGVIHSQGRDIVVATSPSTKDLICKLPPFKEIECFVEVAKIHYPDVHAEKGIDKDGKVDDKVKDIITYPTTTCIHPSLEGKDWIIIEDGQPAFISTDGLRTEFPFQSPPVQSAHFRPPGPPEEPPKLYPLFINESAYQLNGVAFPVYKAIKKVVP